ncbi:MAG: ATP-dependent zinc metalloprotease FtsH [Actinomycetota bacterium]
MSDTSTDHQRPEGAEDRAPQWRVEGVDDDSGGSGRWFRPMRRRTFWFLVGGLLFVNWVIASSFLQGPEPLHFPYTTFLTEVEAGNVVEVESRGETIEGVFDSAVAHPTIDAAPTTDFVTERPTFAEDDGLLDLLRERGVVVNANPEEVPVPLWRVALFSFGPTLLLVGIFVLVFRRIGSGMGGIGGLGRSKARRYEDSTTRRVTFADVAGIDEAEGELAELVDFLRHPEKYARLGGTIPTGVLLSGPPGTGKTLLARAVAGEAEVPFFSSSASEFIEMVVGVGASRVRDLFAEALKLAPSIIFIDELDAVGRARGAGSGLGGNDEREQTLNQILTEMDGFSGSEGVIVLAATNRPEILDQALLRPGRFDRQVVVNAPDQAGRQAILDIHTQGVPLADDVDLTALASSTPGMVGADLRNLVNEAALTAARLDHAQVQMADLTNALEKILLGVERNIAVDPVERQRTAYHESGHALLAMLEPGADPVRKISIIPRGGALGVTLSAPDSDRYSHDAPYLLGRIKMFLGGRAAEEIVYGTVTTGAASDLDAATHIARNMVGRWGMSPAVGLVTTMPPPGQESPFGRMAEASPATLELVDAEVRRIVDEAYAAAKQTLTAHREKLDALTSALLERETLDEIDAYAVAGIERETDLRSQWNPSLN